MCFWVQIGKFLGFIVTKDGIKVDPMKIRAIQDMTSPICKMDVQQLTGKLAALNRFISILSGKCRTFFNLHQKKQNFKRKLKCQMAFDHIKIYLSSVPTLSPPVPGEKLYLYTANTSTTVSAVLVRVKENRERQIYFNKVLPTRESYF